MRRVLLALDLSTTASGWARYDLNTKELISYGVVEPTLKKTKKTPQGYPEFQTLKIKTLTDQVLELIDSEVHSIVIEEINRGKNRIGQKLLDGFHYLLLAKMAPDALAMVSYRDSDGATGWRSAQGLNLQLSEYDKAVNKERNKLNKKLGRGEKKLPLITKKTLACRFVNKQFGLELDCDKLETDGDKADAIGLGFFFLNQECP